MHLGTEGRQCDSWICGTAVLPKRCALALLHTWLQCTAPDSASAVIHNIAEALGFVAAPLQFSAYSMDLHCNLMFHHHRFFLRMYCAALVEIQTEEFAAKVLDLLLP